MLFGLTSVVALGGGSLANAFISLFFGLLISTVGTDQIYGVDRFTFGCRILADGIEFLVVMVGAYGVGEVLVAPREGIRLAAAREDRECAHRAPDLAEMLDAPGACSCARRSSAT